MRRAWSWWVCDSWQRSLARLALVAIAGVVAALLFIAAGLAPIAASKGHWPITRTLLHYAMIRGVQTRALAVKEPPAAERPLDRQAMVLKGAGHYASHCLACHGAPGIPRSEVVRHMSPAPPYLPPEIDRWSDAELFWIVRHGVKFTAMPAWPSDRRDDEVWAMAAFLRQLPRLEPRQFRQLAWGESAALAPTGAAALTPGTPRASNAGSPLPVRTADCARCHGADGNGRGTGAFPALAGQSETYLLASLQAYARGERHSGMMQVVAAGLETGEMIALSRYYSRQPRGKAVANIGGDGPVPGSAMPPAGQAGSPARGRQLAQQGDPVRRVPSCVECHGPGNRPRNPMYPRLAGLHPEYLALQLHLFKRGQRGGTGYAHIMHTVAASLERRDIDDLAAWYGSLPPPARDSSR